MSTPVTGDDEIALNWLRAIAAKLSAAGLSIRLHHTPAGSDLTATLHHPGRREIDALIDDDGYIELRYWADPAGTPAQVADTIVRAFSAVVEAHTTRTEPSHERTASRTQDLSVVGSPDRAMGAITGYDGAVTERAGDGGMTGPQDRLTEQQTSPDRVRPYTPDKVDPGLLKRMERLPQGHPSSPYNADGTRRPPVPDITSSELPIPGDPDYHPETPGSLRADRGGSSQNDDSLRDAAEPPASPADEVTDIETPTPDDADLHLGTPDAAQTGPDGSWEWKGRPLTAEQSHSGDRGLERCREAEGRDMNGNYSERGLTPTMRRIEAGLEHGKLAPDTEKFALKSVDRFKLKLAERIALQPAESTAALVSRIHDGIRYTFIYDDEHYTSSSQDTEAALERDGYELITRKPSWDSADYKGTNSQWLDPDSRLFFEIQFHTHASWEAKQTTHSAYEKLADPRATPEERARLDAYQREITASVPVPPGALEIPYYHKEGA